MTTINAALLEKLPLAQIWRVAFYKRDEITTDLSCRDVAVGDKVWSFHEENVGWVFLLQHVQKLPQFRSDWFEAVTQSAFATNETIAFSVI